MMDQPFFIYCALTTAPLFLGRNNCPLLNASNEGLESLRAYALIARLTKFSISGILKPLCASARAPSEAMPATLAAVTAPLAFP